MTGEMTKMRNDKKIVITFIIIILLAGAGGYGFMSHANAVNANEQKLIEEMNTQRIQAAKEEIIKLYANPKKEALAADLSKQKIDNALEKVKLVKDIKLKSSMENELSKILFLFNFQKEIRELLEKGVIANDVKLTQITTMNNNFDQVKVINSRIADTYKSNVQIINSQFNAIQAANKKVQSLFSDYKTLTVKGSVSKVQYSDAMKMVDSIKNTKAKNDLKNLLEKVNTVLVSKERKDAVKDNISKQNPSIKEKQQGPSNSSTKGKQQKTASISSTSSKVIKKETGLAAIVARSQTAKKTNQIVTVVASGTNAQVTLLEKRNGTWEKVITTSGHVGSQGVGTASESLSRTPKGSYSLGFAFGTSNPGTQLPFRKITPKSYWISNVKDPHYNSWQERTSSSKYDEHLADYPIQYHYAIVINYHNGVGGGSGFFLHCDNGRPTAGCVSVPTSVMAQFMKRIHSGAYIINVTSESSLANY